MKRRFSFAVVIATRDRPSLLAQRALASVAAQDRKPDIVVVADDSDARCGAANKKTLRAFSAKTEIASAYLSEQKCNVSRVGGAHNRARNLGALHLLNAGFNPQNTYIAVLDDDDEWLPNHLSQAEKFARRGADFMPYAYTRREPDRVYVRTLSKFDGRDFLIGNPGVEGSTLIIRLSSFMRAGMFDESLPASDDRDLCFRLSLLPELRWRQPPAPSVVYYGDEERGRLTLRKGTAQLAGLSRFADKYRGWMTAKEYAAFCRRAKKLFGWTEPEKTPRTAAMSTPHKMPGVGGGKVALVIGVITEPRQKNNPLFSDILALSRDRRLSSVDVVVVPSSGSDRKTFRGEMEKWRRAGLRIHCAADTGPEMRKLFGPNNSRGIRPISVNRTILQRAVSRLAAEYRRPVCWILDGDSRLHGLKISGGRVVSFRPDYVGEMMRLRKSGCDIAVGTINGAAPLPRAFTARTQMVDLMHILGRLQSSGRHSPKHIACMDAATLDDGYYHDCFSHSHLEQPLGIPPTGIRTADDFIGALPNLLRRLLAGDWITRPLLHFGGAECPHRGGNTFVFHPKILDGVPNGFVRGGLREIRRQDEIWRIVAEKTRGAKTGGGNFPVTQERNAEMPQAPDIARIARDIAGHAFVSALRRVRGQFDGAEDLVKHILHPNSDFFDNVDAAMRTRISAARASFFRTAGVAACMRAMIDSADVRDKRNGRAAKTALRNMERRFSESALSKARTQTARLLSRGNVRKAVADFPKICGDFSLPSQPREEEWIKNERRANAAILARRIIGKTPRFLGQGSEGASFTDGKNVFKVLHRWYSRDAVAKTNFLPSLAGKWPADGPAYPIVRAENNDGDLILHLPFEKTTPYSGGCGAGMVKLLAALKRRGVVLWDVNPKNLRRNGNGVRLIDYGRHIRPFTARDFDLMTRKAWLSCRLARRKDLRALLTASLTNKNMPELQGYEILKSAVEQVALCRSRIPDSALREAVKNGARRILDCGSGKGKDAAALAARGIRVDAYDPAQTPKSLTRLRKGGAHVINKPFAVNAYDAVICRHVICEIFSDAELRRCLQDIRRALAPGGRAVVSAYDMDGLARENTCARNILPRGAAIDRKFKYRKHIRATGAVRAHIHRPQSELLREFARVGLRVVTRRAFSDIDIESFTRCGGVLQWTLVPDSQ